MYNPKHMDKSGLRRCKCGNRPRMLRNVNDYDVTYQVKCPVCTARTWAKLTKWGARMAWNRGDVL